MAAAPPDVTGSKARLMLLAVPFAVLAIACAAYLVYVTTVRSTLILQTTPSGVRVSVNGSPVGVTGDSSLVASVDPGESVLLLTRDGYEPHELRVDLRRGEVVEIEQVLRPPGMVYVRGGTFEMGTDAGTVGEKPAHPVALAPYYLDRTEVTVAAFRRYDSGYEPSYDQDSYPATHISWSEADAYCRSIGKRLPTEAEWERACRGSGGRPYAYGDEYDPALARTGEAHDAGPVKVGSFPPGNAGTLDMTGNVWEWCADWYDRDYYGSSPSRDPRGPDTGERRVLRGGAWYSNAVFSKCTHRPGNIRSERDPSFGFRCARDLN